MIFALNRSNLHMAIGHNIIPKKYARAISRDACSRGEPRISAASPYKYTPAASGEDKRLRWCFKPVAKRAPATIEAADNIATTEIAHTILYKKTKAMQ